jgi:ribosome-binding factor A
MRELEFPGALVTLTHVRLAGDDEEFAEVFVAVYPSGKVDEVLKILNKESKKLQWLLLKKLAKRTTPNMRFVADAGNENAARVEKALLDG